jgi:thiamine-phosphate pyrophosphorylase
MKPLDLSLCLVLDPDLCEGAAGMIRTAQIAATQGITVVQLRAPNWKKTPLVRDGT